MANPYGQKSEPRSISPCNNNAKQNNWGQIPIILFDWFHGFNRGQVMVFAAPPLAAVQSWRRVPKGRPDLAGESRRRVLLSIEETNAAEPRAQPVSAARVRSA